jgi:hypothetical protein
VIERVQHRLGRASIRERVVLGDVIRGNTSDAEQQRHEDAGAILTGLAVHDNSAWWCLADGAERLADPRPVVVEHWGIGVRWGCILQHVAQHRYVPVEGVTRERARLAIAFPSPAQVDDAADRIAPNRSDCRRRQTIVTV